MPPLVLFLLGKKGYRVLEAATQGGHASSVAEVVVGTDANVNDDHARAIVEHCERHGIPYRMRQRGMSEPGAVAERVAVAAGWRWLLTDPFRQIVVFHDSLLPKYRGFNPLVTSLLRKDPEIGVTVILATGAFDRGDIVASRSIRVTYPIKLADAIDRVGDLYQDLARAVFASLRTDSTLVGTPQDESMASYSVWRDDEDYRIDWSRTAEDILHQIDCMGFPYKGASAIHEGRLIRILEASIEPDVEVANRDVGKVLFVQHGKPWVICGAGMLRLLKAVDEDGHNVLPFARFRVRLK